MADFPIDLGALNPRTVSDAAGHAVSSTNSRHDVGQHRPQPFRRMEGHVQKEISFADELKLSRDAEKIRQLQVRDLEVRAHEMAHAAVGGSYASSPTYTYERGPDGRNYAVGGSVSIDMSPVPGDPQATLLKAQQVKAAALAPLQPSAKDKQVAQQAQAMATEARNELRLEQLEERRERIESEHDNRTSIPFAQALSAYTRGFVDPGPARLEI